MHRTHAGHGSIWPAETSGKPVEARASDQSTLTPERIAELRGLAEKATPGPWERVDNAAYALNDEGTNRMYLNVFGGYEIQRRNGISVRTAGAEITANAALIVAMRNALPALIDAAERAPVAGWRPIETAPVDLPVLLYCPNLGVANPERIELGPAHTSRGSHHSWATMWMPLPAAPVDGGEDA